MEKVVPDREEVSQDNNGVKLASEEKVKLVMENVTYTGSVTEKEDKCVMENTVLKVVTETVTEVVA